MFFNTGISVPALLEEPGLQQNLIAAADVMYFIFAYPCISTVAEFCINMDQQSL